MKTLTTKIDGYAVELQIRDYGEEPRTDCFITRGNYSASLSCLTDIGMLESCVTGACMPVHPQTISAIERWAEENGY